MTRTGRVRRLLNHYAATHGGEVRKATLLKWMSAGVCPQEILAHAGMSRESLCHYIRAIAADLIYLELIS